MDAPDHSGEWTVQHVEAVSEGASWNGQYADIGGFDVHDAYRAAYTCTDQQHLLSRRYL